MLFDLLWTISGTIILALVPVTLAVAAMCFRKERYLERTRLGIFFGICAILTAHGLVLLTGAIFQSLLEKRAWEAIALFGLWFTAGLFLEYTRLSREGVFEKETGIDWLEVYYALLFSLKGPLVNLRKRQFT